MVDKIFLVQRQSPAWDELAQSQRNGLSVSPVHYLPPMHVPHFPSQLPHLIQKWNETFSLDYFTCRATLKDIASTNNLLAKDVTHINYNDYDKFSESSANSIAYFYDDDDAFDPAISSIISTVDFDGFDVLVSPLLRINEDLFTFVRGRNDTSFLMGRRQEFTSRYQTNNYGLVGSHVDYERFIAMKDHLDASSYAGRSALTDKVISRPVSATFKTIWSASMLKEVDKGRDAALGQLQRFRWRMLKQNLPAEYSWLHSCIKQICALIDCVERGDNYNTLEEKIHEIRIN